MPGEVFNRIQPPTEQSIRLVMPWRMWIEIRDWGRKHERSTSAEIRAAISYWTTMHNTAELQAERGVQVAETD